MGQVIVRPPLAANKSSNLHMSGPPVLLFIRAWTTHSGERPVHSLRGPSVMNKASPISATALGPISGGALPRHESIGPNVVSVAKASGMPHQPCPDRVMTQPPIMFSCALPYVPPICTHVPLTEESHRLALNLSAQVQRRDVRPPDTIPPPRARSSCLTYPV